MAFSGLLAEDKSQELFEEMQGDWKEFRGFEEFRYPRMRELSLFCRKGGIMSTVEIRAELHQMINQADERLLNLVYAMMRADQEDFLSDAHKKLLDDRIREYKNNPESLEDWDDVVRELDGE